MVRRLLQLPLILLVVYTITLTLAWAIPGNPLESDGRRPPAEVEHAMRAQYKLDSFWAFYFSYLRNVTGAAWLLDGSRPARPPPDAAAGAPASRPIFNFGPSLQYEDWTVNDILLQALPVSMSLGAGAILVALVLGVATGVAGASRPGSALDQMALAVALLGISQPTFVIGTLLLLALAVWVPIFPVGGGGLAGAVLPVITLSLPFAAYITRLTRMGIAEQLQADYVRTARAKGASEARVLFGHALRNAILPVVSYLGPATAMAMTGSFVVEEVFSVPGLGQHFVNAVLNKDLFLIIGVVLVFSTMLILFNLAVDLLYKLVDPRIQGAA
ncbi:MAG: ABC transporter permease [Phycisphaerales bacterium]|nr:ABC transporter permease [Phycisphaerales bacterium]